MMKSDCLTPHTVDLPDEPNRWEDFLSILRWRGTIDVHALSDEIQDGIQELLGIGRPKREFTTSDRIQLWNLMKLRLALIEVEAPNFAWPLESASDIVREHETQAINQWRRIGTPEMHDRGFPRNLSDSEFSELSMLLDDYRIRHSSDDLVGSRVPMLFGRQPDAELVPKGLEPFQALKVATVGRGMLDIPAGPKAHELLRKLTHAFSVRSAD